MGDNVHGMKSVGISDQVSNALILVIFRRY